MEVRSKFTTWSILLVNALLVVLGQCDKNAISVAAVPISKEFGFLPTQMGLIISCFFISYTFMNVIGGFLADRYGSRKVILVVAVLWSIFTAITGIAWSFTSLLIIRFIFGAAEGAFPATNSLIVAELFQAEKRAFAKSFITGSSSLGIAVGAIAITQITQAFGWRRAFVVYCLIGFAITALFAWVSRSMKQTGDKAKAQSKPKISYSAVFKVPLLWRILPVTFASGVFQWGLNSWMPSYWMNVKGLKLATMGFASAIPPFATALAMISIGWILDRYMMGREKYVAAISSALAALGVYLTFTAPSVILGVTFNTMASIGAGLLMQSVTACIIKYFPEESIGAGAGLNNAASQFAGIIAPTIMGYIITVTNGSYAAVFGFVIGILIIAFFITFTIDTKEHAKRILAQRVEAKL